MGNLTFNIVDVFAESKFAGNQLAVFRGGQDLSDTEMQRIAKEMNYSETTFILSDEQVDGGYDVRIFTPTEEVPFAGHPTLGTAFILQQRLIFEPVEEVLLNLKVGQIPVRLSYDGGDVSMLWMVQNTPTFGRMFDPLKIVNTLCLDTSDLDDRLPIQEVSTGLPFIIVPLKNLDAVKRARIVRGVEYYDLIKDTEAKAILIFCPETYESENDLNVRMFADYYGVPEDPATGSANGCLNAYLVKHRYFGEGSINLRVEQGYEIGRPSLLYLKGEEVEGKINVQVGGKVQMVAKGEFV